MSQDPFHPENFAPDTDFLEQDPIVPIPQRKIIVPSWYQRHKSPRTTIVTKNGEPIEPGFVVAEVAPELRWAIGEDGEVMEQMAFAQQHEVWYNDQYAFQGQPADDANLRSVPLVERFVARRVDPYDDSRLQPIVRSAEEKAAIEARYNAMGELITEAGAVAPPPGMSLKETEPAEEDTEPAAKAEDETEPETRGFVTPCGKPLSAERYMQQHMKSQCGNPDCEALAKKLRKG